MTTLLVVLAICATVAVGAAILARGVSRSGTRPSSQLAYAVRLLDRILSIDDAVPQLPSDLRDEARRFVNGFYKEIK